MGQRLLTSVNWLFGPGRRDGPGYLWPRWLFLRSLGLVFFSAFYSLLFQVDGLIGPHGILPAGPYLHTLAERLGHRAYWYAPTLLWLGNSPVFLGALCWIGLAASVLLVFNRWPRASLAVCLIVYLSFVAALQVFSSYQSDGMLLCAGFLSLFFAPPGMRPGLGEQQPPSRASLFLLRWLWFTIYFESGIVKLASHDPQWRNLTALDQYYQNGPLPNWIGWYAQQLPHAFHAATALATLIIELGIVWMMLLPRRWRIACFFIVTPFQIGIILTANLAFLNHLVLVLGFLLLDDEFLRSVTGKQGIRKWKLEIGNWKLRAIAEKVKHLTPTSGPQTPDSVRPSRLSRVVRHVSLALSAFFLSWVFYVMTALLVLMLVPGLPLPVSPILALQPFRIANQYGLFAVMTNARYEIEFQGTTDGEHWIPYPFRYKPQDTHEPPRIYAPYQPRFDWNLWFASLGHWRENFFVVRTEIKLLEGSKSVLALFAANPFRNQPPRQVRAVLWQYWFTDLATKRAQGLWWRREWRGLYAPTLEREPDGRTVVTQWPETTLLPPP